jgi:hypothetical protein
LKTLDFSGINEVMKKIWLWVILVSCGQQQDVPDPSPPKSLILKVGLQSEQGDFVGAGKTWDLVYTSATATVSVSVANTRPPAKVI